MGRLRSVSGTPYQWGGEEESQGFDCSGLVYWWLTPLVGPLPRTAEAQRQFFKRRAVQWSGNEYGRLVFSIGSDGRAAHVGVLARYLPDGSALVFDAPSRGKLVGERVWSKEKMSRSEVVPWN